MFYRIRIDLAFDDEDAIHDIQDKVIDHLPDSITINPGELNEERGHITLEQCYHDNNPARPCKVLAHNQSPP